MRHHLIANQPQGVWDALFRDLAAGVDLRYYGGHSQVLLVALERAYDFGGGDAAHPIGGFLAGRGLYQVAGDGPDAPDSASFSRWVSSRSFSCG